MHLSKPVDRQVSSVTASTAFITNPNPMNPANYLRDTIDLVKSIETRFFELAARLYTIKTKELWSGSYDSFQEFLDTAKVNASMASVLTQIHDRYVVQGKIPQSKLIGIGYSNLYEAIPLIDSKGVANAVETAKTLTRQEIKLEVREQKHGACAHPETITICASCHAKI